MSLLHWWTCWLLNWPPGHDGGLGAGAHAPAELVRRRSVEVEHHDVGAAPSRGPDGGGGPVVLTDHRRALLAQDATHAHAHDRPGAPRWDAGFRSALGAVRGLKAAFRAFHNHPSATSPQWRRPR